MTLSEFRAYYPAMKTEQTGGGCTAFYLRIGAQHYVMLTADDDAVAPDDGSLTINLALYAATEADIDMEGAIGGEPAEYTDVVCFEDAAAQIDHWAATTK